MKRIIETGQEARKKLKEGVNAAANAIRPTLGPKGCSALIYTKSVGSPLIIDDGASIAKLLQSDDALVNAGMSLINEVATQADSAGDGPLPKNTKILTPKGVKRYGDLCVGDVVCGTSGTTQTVIGVYDKGVKDIYEIQFSDGRVVECCKDHLWTVTDRKRKNKKVTLTVEQMLELKPRTLNSDGTYSHRFYTPRTLVHFDERPLLLDPYLLGVLIGDGCLCSSGNIELSIGYKKSYILDDIVLPDGINMHVQDVEYRNSLRVKFIGKDKDGHNMHWYIEQLGLLDKKSCSKFIPEDYLYNTLDNRQKLLKGLTDTDGHINKRGLLEYTSISEQLIKDVAFLLRSLGKQCSTRKKEFKEDADRYSLRPIFVLNEHVGSVNGDKIVAIEKTSRKDEMMCIKVSNEDELYVLENFVVTHNTTSSSILADSIITQAIDAIESGVSQKQLKRGLCEASEIVTKYIKEHSKQVESLDDLKNVAYVSSNDKDMAEIISAAVQTSGKNGIIHVENGNGTDTVVETVSGMRYERGYGSRFFVNKPEKGTFELNDCKILLMDKNFSSSADAKHFLQLLAYKGLGALVICESVDENVMGWFLANKQQAGIKICTVKLPGYGDIKKAAMQDIAAMTGATIIGDTSGIELDKLRPEEDPSSIDTYLSYLGTADVVVSANEFVLMKESVDAKATQHIDNLEKQLEETAVNSFERTQLEDRLANLTGSVAIIKVGGITDTEVEAKKAKMEDAKNATKAALLDGYVIGAGSIYLAASFFLDNYLSEAKDKYSDGEKTGFNILVKALKSITKQLGENSNDCGDLVLRDVSAKLINELDNPVTGYNANTNTIENLLDSGIIDATRVIVNSLKKAVSVASTVIMTATVITEQIEESDKMNFAMMRR